MPNLARAKEIAAELEKTEAWRSRGGVAVGIASAMLSAIPVGGGPLAALSDKIGGALLDPEIEPKFIELCKLVAALAPDIERIESIDAKLALTAAVLQENKGAMDRMTALLQQVHPCATSVFGVHTVASRQDFVNVAIRDMNLLVEAHQAGVNYLKGVKAKGGDAHFSSTGGGYQRVEDSTFSGKSGASVGMDKLVLQGKVGTVDGGAEHPGIGLGEGGSIGFGPDGVLGFGPAKRKGGG